MLGIIDCGTNTFHLLVAEAQADGTFRNIYKERNYVRLGQEGLHRIGKAPFHRGIECIVYFQKKLSELGIGKLKVFGTEALRRAENAGEFVAAVKAATGVQIEIISGQEEARLIHLGVMQAVPPFKGKGLIVDIGGGSVEFIIASQRKVHWAQSFPIGVQVLFNSFQKSDPISALDIAAIERHLEATLTPLFEALQIHRTSLLLGASGSFEVVEDMLGLPRSSPLFTSLAAKNYASLHQQIIASSLAERLQMPKLPPERAELIVVAFVLIDFVLRNVGIRSITISAYAMKEGMLMEMDFD